MVSKFKQINKENVLIDYDRLYESKGWVVCGTGVGPSHDDDNCLYVPHYNQNVSVHLYPSKHLAKILVDEGYTVKPNEHFDPKMWRNVVDEFNRLIKK